MDIYTIRTRSAAAHAAAGRLIQVRIRDLIGSNRFEFFRRQLDAVLFQKRNVFFDIFVTHFREESLFLVLGYLGEYQFNDFFHTHSLFPPFKNVVVLFVPGNRAPRPEVRSL